VIRRPDLPEFDPARLNLPPKPKVVQIRTESYETAVGTEGLEVVVVLDKLTRAQQADRSWARPYRAEIESALQEHRADYDRSSPVLRAHAQHSVFLAREARGRWSRIEADEARAFLRAALTWRSLAGR